MAMLFALSMSCLHCLPDLGDIGATEHKAAGRRVFLHGAPEGVLSLLGQAIHLVQQQHLESFLAFQVQRPALGHVLRTANLPDLQILFGAFPVVGAVRQEGLGACIGCQLWQAASRRHVQGCAPTMHMASAGWLANEPCGKLSTHMPAAWLTQATQDAEHVSGAHVV